MNIDTPYYLIDENKLLKNLKIIKYIRENSGAKSVLALKCFSTWCVFGLMKRYMDGVTASSPYEARLGKEKFGKEIHVYSVGFSNADLKEVVCFTDVFIFNSVTQLKKSLPFVGKAKVGLRINPRISYSHFDLADPARKFSRLGVVNKKLVLDVLSKISGVMFHFNCENYDFKNFCANLDYIGHKYEEILRQVEWVSLGGGLYFTKNGYPVAEFCKKLKKFSEEFDVQVYLEPGESTITESTQLVTSVLDIVHNVKDIAIVDASTEAHMLDLLIYRINAKVEGAGSGPYQYVVAGRSCLAGDVFGTYNFKAPIKIGDKIKFLDAGGYTMVKKNWFNGLKMPSIVVKRLGGKIDLVRRFTYKDFESSLS